MKVEEKASSEEEVEDTAEEDEEDESPETLRRLSYQSGNSSGGGDLNSNSHHNELENLHLSLPSSILTGPREIAGKVMQRFSFEGGWPRYENPPSDGEDDDDSFSDEDGIHHGPTSTRRTKRQPSLPCDSSYCLKVVGWWFCLGLLVLGIKIVWDDLQPPRSPSIYTGDAASVCENLDEKATLMQQLKLTSSLEDIEHGAVASDQPVCSQVGLSILRDHDGNAVDAAVAIALCLGVANPSSSGIGGGSFILIHADATHREMENMPDFIDARPDATPVVHSNGKVTEVIDCRENAGAAASTMMYETEGVASDASIFGGLAIAVPGELRGLELAHARHGRLEWKTVVQPAVDMARNGVPVSAYLAHCIDYFAEKSNDHDGLPTLRKLLTRNDNWAHPLKEGDLIRNPKLAETLEAIIQDGSDAMYTGTRAQQLAEDIQRAGGILTKEDLEQYRATLRNPLISDEVFGVRVVGVPPPSSGGAVIMGALRFLAGYQTPLVSFADTLTVHRMVEALKHVFSIRMSMGDPDFPRPNEVTNATTQDAVDALTKGPYMEQLRQLTSDSSTLNLSHYGGQRFAQLNDSDGQGQAKDAKEGDRRRLESSRSHDSVRHRRLFDPFGYLNDNGTSHFSVVDKDGNSVAMTTSVNALFGSCVLSESTGILLNNQMDDFGNPGKPDFFGLRPAEANFIKPGKKPLSSMSPTMVFQVRQDTDDDGLGDLRMVVGGSGGPKIISAVFQVITNHLFLGRPLFESVAHPRIHNQLIYHGAAATNTENSIAGPPPGVNLEVSNRTKTALEARGNLLVDINYAGTVQAVTVDMETGRLSAVSDIRKGGTPAGY